jgi:multidrug efflux pump subunit AcrB
MLLSAVVSFYFTPAMFALIHRRAKIADSTALPLPAE